MLESACSPLSPYKHPQNFERSDTRYSENVLGQSAVRNNEGESLIKLQKTIDMDTSGAVVSSTKNDTVSE
jgi:hypothetical protein